MTGTQKKTDRLNIKGLVSQQEKNFVNASGRISSDSGEELRKIQSGKVQSYAAILFAAATILAGLLIVIV